MSKGMVQTRVGMDRNSESCSSLGRSNMTN